MDVHPTKNVSIGIDPYPVEFPLKIQKTLYLMVKTMVPVDFPLNQSCDYMTSGTPGVTWGEVGEGPGCSLGPRRFGGGGRPGGAAGAGANAAQLGGNRPGAQLEVQGIDIFGMWYGMITVLVECMDWYIYHIMILVYIYNYIKLYE